MDMSIVTSLLAARQSATRDAISMSVVKQQHQMEMNMVQMLTEAVENIPPPGQCAQVNKTA
jgi:hypothetical protein